MDDAEVWNGTDWVHHDLTGGWHDAGDYNKYNSWFQTQWYCIQALAEVAMLDHGQVFSTMPVLYDSNLPDAVDEALWGAKFILNCVNVEGIQGPEHQYRVWETVSGYRHDTERESRMGYWGPPELDWTTPRRVVFNEYNETFVSWTRGYGIAATLHQVARLVDNFSASHPGIEFPGWAETNTSYIREIADAVYDKHLDLQGANQDDLQSYVGKFFYLEESWYNGNATGADIDNLVLEIMAANSSWGGPLLAPINSYALWFGWAGEYLLGNILTHYLENGRVAPAPLLERAEQFQEQHFSELFPGPFHVKHSISNGTLHLFYGAERMTAMLTSTWLQSLLNRLEPSSSKPELIQAMVDWVLGVNPAGLCILEGVGHVNVPQYHHRYASAKNPRGAVPGALPFGLAPLRVSKTWALVNGLEDNSDAEIFNFSLSNPEFFDRYSTASWPGNPLNKDGVPSNPNEVWIPHNAMWLRLFSSMKASDPFS